MPTVRCVRVAVSGFILMLGATLQVGCGKSAGTTGAPGSFESDVPTSQGGGAEQAGGNASGASSDASAPRAVGAQDEDSKGADFDAGRAIVEADVVQIDGDRLYALSRVAGLAVIDVSNPAKLKLLGRYRELPATPFEMYLRGEVAILMFSGWGQYVAADDGAYSWVSSSKVVALDVAKPDAIQTLGTFDVPGTISDSRVVGDVLYVVGYEDGYCWRCEQNKPTTAISSLDLRDAHAIRKVDELRYGNVDSQYSWTRSISVTNQRMYVAGPEYGEQGPVGSTIQVVDISDPGGDLVEGAVLKAQGQISNRWQMDEYEGVLRVVSQSPQWRTTDPPTVQTFQVISSKEFKPLGRTNIVIPRGETLRSARFDGPRGYLITALQQDPLFTLDLSDPAKPRQVGELVMPGFVYHMEPRGDRVLGLGFDQGNPAGSITVSLFDVSDLSAPSMLSRVNFGGNWGQLPEDQDRIHKVFKVLPELGLILVPYSGWEQTDSRNSCGGKSVGGVQLVDYRDDKLGLRGAAPSTGQARRALVHSDHLLAVSDQRVEAFGIVNRDEPKLVSQLILANNLQYAKQLDGGVVARITTPDWDGRWFLELVDAAHAEDPNTRLGELSLDGTAESDASVCDKGWNVESVHADGSQLYVLYNSYLSRTEGTGEQRTGVLVIDAKDPSKPRVSAETSWSNGDGSGWYTYYGDYSYGGFGQGQAHLWHGSMLAMLEQKYDYLPGGTSIRSVRLRVVDLRNADALTSTTLRLSGQQQYSSLIADGDRILTSHFQQPSATGAVTRAKFYVDGFDVSDPSSPKALAPINVPGALVHYDRESGRALTTQLHRVVATDLNYQQCYERFANAEFDYGTTTGIITERTVGKCVGYTQSLHLVELRDDGANLEDSLTLAENQRVAASSAGDGVWFATLGRGGYYYGGGFRGGFLSEGIAADCAGPCGGGISTPAPVELLVLGGFGSGKLEVGHLKVKSDSNDWWGFWGTPPIYAHGTQALLVSNGDVAIVDAADPTAPKIARTVPLVGSVQSVDIRDDEALLALGQQGVQWIDL